MNLITDIGNSYTKLAVFDKNILINKLSFKNEKSEKTSEEIVKLKQQYPQIKNFILSSVKKEDRKLRNLIRDLFQNYVFFNDETPVPIKNLYETPKTLGKDRLAGIIAAGNIFPNSNVLVFDAGTALTVDFLNDEKEYSGGSIAPGLEMRYQALNHFTDKLPKLEISDNFEHMIGKNTENSIHSGVQNGILYEIEGWIKRFSEKYTNLKVTFTGGDTFFFERRLKKQIFAEPNLVLIGLNIILKYNAK